MSIYDLVKDGAVVATRDFAAGTVPALAPNKGEWLLRVIVDPPCDPVREIKTGPIVTIEAARVLHTYAIAERPLADRQEKMRRSVNLLTDQKTSAGYEHDFGSAGIHRLQTREQDRPNWLALAQVAAIAIGQGQGGEPLSGIRTEANETIPVTADAALAAMLGMQQHLGAIMSRGWTLKDAIAQAIDHDDLDAIDIAAGWPA